MNGPVAPSTEVVALVLAAGRSRRFGADKRQALLADGRSVLTASLTQARQIFAEVWVVLRPEDDVQTLGIPTDVGIILSEQAALGMGSSLADGINALSNTSASAVAILLGDMPWIEPASLRTLVNAANPHRIAIPWYDGVRGHPVVFGRHFWPELSRIHGDEGAKTVIRTHSSLCDVVHLDDPAILWDVDTIEDLG